MSDKVKLIIEISKKDYEWAKQIAKIINESVYCDRQIIAISNGVLLDNDSERAEVQAYFDGQAYGWDEGRKAMIDEVMAEIEKAKRFHVGTFEDDNPIDHGIVEGFDKAIVILKNIGRGDSE